MMVFFLVWEYWIMWLFLNKLFFYWYLFSFCGREVSVLIVWLFVLYYKEVFYRGKLIFVNVFFYVLVGSGWL